MKWPKHTVSRSKWRDMDFLELYGEMHIQITTGRTTAQVWVLKIR